LVPVAALTMPGLVNDTTDQDKVAELDDVGQLGDELLLVLTIDEETKISFLLPDLMFVEHHQVVTEVVERSRAGYPRACLVTRAHIRAICVEP
jgi:hypothetical protein